jgi:16S rRNA (adenine1518-N6/adenine1519-N6)-dimethyltransferase
LSRERLPSPFSAARKRFGQNFLEPAWVDKLIREIAPHPSDTFLEIGPGRGALTRPLADRVGRLVAFEIDHDLAAALTAWAPAHVTVVDADFLEVTAERLRALLTTDEWSRPIRVAGNLPYNVASPILFKLVDLHAAGVPLTDAHVMLQREVADRLVSAPGTAEYGVLAVLLGHVAAVSRVLSLPPGAFRPAPKVHSAVVRLRFHAPDPAVKSGQVFSDVVRAVFTRRRKTLANALLAYRGRVSKRENARDLAPRDPSPGRENAKDPASRDPSPVQVLRAADIDGTRRPETLTIAEFARLADALAALSLPGGR